MSIARQKKISVLGRAQQETEVLSALQELGCMHLLPLGPPPAHVEETRDRTAKDAYVALRFLADAPERRRQVRRDAGFDIHAFVPQVLEIRARLRETLDRCDFLEHRIEAVRPWGDLVFPPKEELAGYHLWFYRLPVRHREALERVELPWEIVHTDTKFA